MQTNITQYMDPHLREYLHILLKRKNVIILTIILFAFSVFIRNLFLDPVYRATGQLLIEKETPKIVEFPEVMSVNAKDTDYYQTQYKILRSRTLAKSAVLDLKIKQNPEFNPGVSGKTAGTEPLDEVVPSSIIDRFLKHLKIEPIRRSRLVNVSFYSKSPELSVKAANRIMELYIDLDRTVKFQTSHQAGEWLTEKLDSLKEQVTKAENTLQEYKEKQDIYVDSEKMNIINQK